MRAAERLFATQGFANTRINEITAAARTGISTFYRSFDSKEALLEALVLQLTDDLSLRLGPWHREIVGAQPLARLAAIERGFAIGFEALAARPHLTRVLLRSLYGSRDAVERVVARALAEVTSRNIELFSIAVAEGRIVLAPERIESFATAVLGMVFHLADQMITRGRPSAVEAARTCARIVDGMIVVSMPPARFEESLPMIRTLLEQPAAAFVPLAPDGRGARDGSGTRRSPARRVLKRS